MIPLYVLVVSFVMFRASGVAGFAYFSEWQSSLQAAVAVMLLVAASAHWGSKRRDLIRMVPPAFPRPDLIVTITGLLEIAGAAGLLFPVTSRIASICLALLLVAMFPANIKAANESLTLGGRPVPKLPVRTLLQLIFIAAVLLAG
ncbi:hypothetical protein [Paenibacillus mesotrionivorans]|uniref:Uncharacterized protein n=1 Tax=Paenibacillus mesotrionivorans TaxID=3160968 RepID=A0ACC7NX59_9BACL